MLKSIQNNPYRVLGVCSNSPLKDRVANQNKMKAFAKVGKEMAFPLDLTGTIGSAPQRDTESVAEATKLINLPEDQLLYALFWFIEKTPIDTIALNHLKAGDVAKALEILNKKSDASSLINKGVISFIKGDNKTGFQSISAVLNDATWFGNLLEYLGINNGLSGEDADRRFIEVLLKQFPASELIGYATTQEERNLIGTKAVEEPIRLINQAISVAQNAPRDDARANLVAGTKLMNETKSLLAQVQSIAGRNSLQYQTVADSLAKQILQSGINYYNNSDDDDSPRKAMVLQEYALKIAVGKLTKDRCQENYDILKKAVDSMPPAAVIPEVKAINAELERYCKLPDKISHAITLLNNTKPQLTSIKNKLGAANALYLKLSTQVVGNALHNVIEEVNAVQKPNIVELPGGQKFNLDDMMSPEDRRKKLSRIISALREAQRATFLMDSYDMESSFKSQRYDPNRSTLMDLCRSAGISSYSSSSSSSSTRTTYRPSASTTSSSFSSDDTPWGCIIWAIIIGIIILINVL